jgi:hypothetical protein
VGLVGSEMCIRDRIYGDKCGKFRYDKHDV